MNTKDYLMSGQFEADARGFGYEFDGEKAVKLPSAGFWDRVPSHAKPAFEYVMQLVATEKFPSLYCFRVTSDSWGFDFEANECSVLDDEFEKDLSHDVFSMALDGGGNHYCLFVSGELVVWNHEESNIEGHTRFATLDDALWALLRYEAVKDDKLSWSEVRPVFEKQAQEADNQNGWGFLLEELDEEYEGA